MTHVANPLTATIWRNVLGRRYAGLGTRPIWFGLIGLVAVQAAFDLGQTASGFAEYAHPQLILTAWGLVLVANLAIIPVIRMLGGHLPDWIFALYVVALVTGLLLDLAATWNDPHADDWITAGRTAVISLLIALPSRPEKEIAGVGLAMTLITAVAMVLDGHAAPESLANSVFVLCQLGATILVAVVGMASFRDLVRREIERELSRASLTAPQLTVGSDESAQLARLDLAAESLLSAVADGRVGLPLEQEIARRAGTIATELRAHLLESRSVTWLDLAIEESDLLTAVVAVDDPANAAGLLTPMQRGALLSALWVLADRLPAPRPGRSGVQVRFASSSALPPPEQGLVLPIEVRLARARGSGLDAGVWEHLGRIGDYREVYEQGGFRVEIRAIVPIIGPHPPAAR